MFYILSRTSENVFLEHFKGSLDEKIFYWAFHDFPFMRTREYDWSNALVTLRFHEQMNINKLCSSWQLMLIPTQKDLFFHSFHIIPFHLFVHLPFCPCINLFSNFFISNFSFILNRLFHFPHSFFCSIKALTQISIKWPNNPSINLLCFTIFIFKHNKEFK